MSTVKLDDNIIATRFIRVLICFPEAGATLLGVDISIHLGD